MLIAIEHRDCPVCETLSQNQPESGIAYLPAVSVRFLLDPRELRLQYEAGCLCRDLNCGDGIFRPAPDDAARLYRKNAKETANEPQPPEHKFLNEIA
ncbi:MAG: hypothetical protein LKJ17_04125 [Oscillospiraceae bacterium]|jgi:hypothetical protein|nr:hypothetical protein [Oscillospiraceae bacterium]